MKKMITLFICALFLCSCRGGKQQLPADTVSEECGVGRNIVQARRYLSSSVSAPEMEIPFGVSWEILNAPSVESYGWEYINDYVIDEENGKLAPFSSEVFMIHLNLPDEESSDKPTEWSLRTFNTEEPERLTHYSRVPNFGGAEEPAIYWDDTENKVLYFEDGTYAPYKACITISKVTSYCACEICCGVWSGYGCTNSEHMFQWNDKFVATDVAYLSWLLGREVEYGTHIYLEGEFYSIEDAGVSGSWVDIWNPTHWGALQHGMTYNVPMYIFD